MLSDKELQDIKDDLPNAVKNEAEILDAPWWKEDDQQQRVNVWRKLTEKAVIGMRDIIRLDPNKAGIEPCLYIIGKLMDELKELHTETEFTKKVNKLYAQWDTNEDKKLKTH